MKFTLRTATPRMPSLQLILLPKTRIWCKRDAFVFLGMAAKIYKCFLISTFLQNPFKYMDPTSKLLICSSLFYVLFYCFTLIASNLITKNDTFRHWHERNGIAHMYRFPMETFFKFCIFFLINKMISVNS